MGDQNGGQLPCYTRISEPTAQESSAAGRSWSSRPSTFGLGGSDKAFLRSCGVHAQIGFRTVMRAQLGRKAAWSCTSLHGRNAAIRHPLPLPVRQIMDKRTGFHEYLQQSGAGGVRPRRRLFLASFQGSAPRHIKTAALTRCVAAHLHLRCFCISSTLGLFVTFTVRVISTARRTPLVGDLERMPALFIFVQGFFGGTSVMYLHLQPQKGTSS